MYDLSAVFYAAVFTFITGIIQCQWILYRLFNLTDYKSNERKDTIWQLINILQVESVLLNLL